jgi:hypothetical protein
MVRHPSSGLTEAQTPHTVRGFLCRLSPAVAGQPPCRGDRHLAQSLPPHRDLAPLLASCLQPSASGLVDEAGLSGLPGSGWSAHDPDPGARAGKPTIPPPHNAHTRTGLSHFVFPDCQSAPRCAADLVFFRCMRMNPLAPSAGGAFFIRAVLCATGPASAAEWWVWRSRRKTHRWAR